MIDKEKQDQWDREMAQVDKLLSKLPTYESGKPALGGEATQRRPPAAPPPGAAPSVGAWVRVGLGAALAIGVTVWPYSHVCGLKLIFYLVGVLTLVVAGVWAGLAAWRQRAGLAHVVSFVIVLWGLVLAAQAVLPRVGYAKTDALWLCPEPPPAQPQPRPSS